MLLVRSAMVGRISDKSLRFNYDGCLLCKCCVPISYEYTGSSVLPDFAHTTRTACLKNGRERGTAAAAVCSSIEGNLCLQ